MLFFFDHQQFFSVVIYCIIFVHFAFINSPVVHCTFTRYALGANPSRQHNNHSGSNKNIQIENKRKIIAELYVSEKERERARKKTETEAYIYTPNGKWRRSLKQCRIYCRNNQIVVIQPY